VCLAEFASRYNNTLLTLQPYFAIAYYFNFFALVMQMLGMLSNPLVTLMWGLEQVDVHVLGSTERASDLRIVGSILMNGAIVVGMYLIGEDKIGDAVIMGVGLAWIASHNLMLDIGMGGETVNGN